MENLHGYRSQCLLRKAGTLPSELIPQLYLHKPIMTLKRSHKKQLSSIKEAAQEN